MLIPHHRPVALSHRLVIRALLAVAVIALSGCPNGSPKRGPTPKTTAATAPARAGSAQPRRERPPVAGRLPKNASVIFLHHSTGENIWNGGVASWIARYNKKHETHYNIAERAFPHEPYPWDNYPYDYWNIWVKHAGPQTFEGQETLETLTRQYQVIVFKHCYPVSAIEPDSGSPDVSSSQKTAANYRAQYAALKTKLRSFPNNRFIVWTGAALTRTAMSNDYGGNAAMAKRARQFFQWVKGSWDEPGDNIYVFDFYELETEGSQYLLDKHAVSAGDPHPNERFARSVAPRFARRVVDVIEGRGDAGSLTGG